MHCIYVLPCSQYTPIISLNLINDHSLRTLVLVMWELNLDV